MMEMVSIADMMTAREKRWIRQQAYQVERSGTLVCFMLNIPGPVKISNQFYWAFEEGIRRILDVFKLYHLNIVMQKRKILKTGYEFYLVTDADSTLVKRHMTTIENKDRLGRLFDIDVFDADHQQVSRHILGQGGRQCLLCTQDAKVCGRSRKHTVDEMLVEIDRIIVTARVESALKEALLSEVHTTPKPGLVDLHDNGAHKDMNVETFENSTEAVWPWLLQMFQSGLYWEKDEVSLFTVLRELGIKAERDMLLATDNVNTHKGAIFTLGLIAGAAGKVYREVFTFNVEKILKMCQAIAADTLEMDFHEMIQRMPSTHGEILYFKFAERGIRGEAQKGFPIIANKALPLMRRCKCAGISDNQIYVQVLLTIMTELTDTNVLSRSGYSYKELRWLQAQAKEALAAGGAMTEDGMTQIRLLNEACITKNLSPGGSADLLAATIFLYRLSASRP